MDNPAYAVGDGVGEKGSIGVSSNDIDLQMKVNKAESHLDTRYGFLGFKPRCLQVFDKISWYVFWTFAMCLLEGFAVNGIANAALPAIEKQFDLSSTKSALIPSAQDIGALIVVLPISFIGGRYNKVMFVATGSIIMALGSFLFMVPHLASTYDYSSVGGGPSSNDFCPTKAESVGSPACTEKEQSYLSLFVIAQVVHGIGFTPMFTLGTVYIDENEEHTKAAMYIGMTYAAAAIGVAVGFFVGGQFIQKIYVDFDKIDGSIEFNAMDPRWVGAWWLGFVITVVGFLLVAIPLYGFPKFLPGNIPSDLEESELRNMPIWSFLKRMFKTFFKTLLHLIKNPVYMFLNLGGAAETLIISGVGAFSFKFLAEQYQLDFDTAGFLIGGLILTGSLGMFLGGVIIRIFGLELKGMAFLNVVTASLAALLGISFLAGCPNVKLVGLEVPYPGQSAVQGYINSCQGNCSCSGQTFSPVCGADNNVYYSACHAGCQSGVSGPMGTMSYSNCSCISASLGVASTDDGATAMSNRCRVDDCNNIYVIAPCLFLALCAVLLGVTPTSMATLRCVQEDERPFALGLQWMFIRLLGTIPGPVLVGWVLDKSCLIWTEGSCGNGGFCMMYNLKSMATGVLTWWVAVCFCAAILFLCAGISVLCRKKASHDIN